MGDEEMECEEEEEREQESGVGWVGPNRDWLDWLVLSIKTVM